MLSYIVQHVYVVCQCLVSCHFKAKINKIVHVSLSVALIVPPAHTGCEESSLQSELSLTDEGQNQQSLFCVKLHCGDMKLI